MNTDILAGLEIVRGLTEAVTPFLISISKVKAKSGDIYCVPTMWTILYQASGGTSKQLEPTYKNVFNKDIE